MIEEIAWDTAFFGRKIGRIAPPASAEEIRQILEWAGREKFAYLTCRLDALEVRAVQILETAGFYVTDFGLVFERGPEGLKPPRKAVRQAAPEDSDAVGRIAADLFSDGRFYRDPFFTGDEASRLYRAWAENSVKGTAADRVFLIDGEGFVTCKISGGEGKIVLFGVSADHRGKGTGSALILTALGWFRDEGALRVKVRTQAGNLPAIGFYGRMGFMVSSADITMGKVLLSQS